MIMFLTNFRFSKVVKMSLAELPCYTIINVPSDFETPNEIQLKNDLEKGDIKVSIHLPLVLLLVELRSINVLSFKLVHLL